MDLARDIGSLEARLDEHGKRVDRIEGKIDEGFSALNSRLDTLTAAENQRKGARSVLKVLLGGGTIAGAYEGIKAWLGH